LAVTKTVKPKVVTVGDNQTFTIKVTNERGGIARDVTMTDRLPDQVRFIRASTSRHVPGSCGLVARTVTCELGDLEVGQRVTVKIFVKTAQAGRYSNQAFVTHTIAELEGADNQDKARSRATRE
jgi:large repetitive protein